MLPMAAALAIPMLVSLELSVTRAARASDRNSTSPALIENLSLLGRNVPFTTVKLKPVSGAKQIKRKVGRSLPVFPPETDILARSACLKPDNKRAVQPLP